MSVTVDDLKSLPFKKRPKAEQIKILKQPRPQPRLRKLIRKFIPDKDATVVPFYDSLYEKEIWLCGCEKRDSLFCWTCLLFIDEPNLWNLSGTIDPKFLKEEIRKHKVSLNHLHGFLQYHLFQKENGINPKTNPVPEIHCIKKNREALKRIIDVVCYMALQASSPKRSTDETSLLNPADCVKLLSFLKNRDDQDIVDEAINLVENCPKVVPHIVIAVARLLNEEIGKETKFSTFVSLIFSDHSSTNTQTKLSTVVRYVRDGKIFERFMGFKNFDSEKTINLLKECLSKALEELDIEEKSKNLLAVSVDGGILHLKYKHHFLKFLNQHYPETLFVPCYFHDFNSVLLQTLFEIPECDLFLKITQSIKAFFGNNSKMCTRFRDFTNGNVIDFSELKLTDAQFIKILKVYRLQFVHFFQSVAESCEDYSEEETVEANCFQRALEEHQIVFLLETLFTLFEKTAFLDELLSSYSLDGAFENEVLEDVITRLQEEKDNGFAHVWTTTMAEILENNQLEITNSIEEEETQELFQLFLRILDCFIVDVETRFTFARRISFLGIFDQGKRTGMFDPMNYYLNNLTGSKQPYFDYPQLKIEMKVLSKFEWPSNRTDCFFQISYKKSASDLVEFFRRKNLHMSFRNLFKLAEFVVTLPCKPTSFTNGSAKYDSIKAWGSFSKRKETDALSVLNIENDLVEYLKSQIKFYDNVILKLNATMQQMFPKN